VYQANVTKIGLLGVSLGADVVKVMAPTAVRQTPTTSDTPFPHEIVALWYDGLASRMSEWHGELYHMAMRFRAAEAGTPDPGTLLERSQRQKQEETVPVA
jgi:hypothetical protein